MTGYRSGAIVGDPELIRPAAPAAPEHRDGTAGLRAGRGDRRLERPGPRRRTPCRLRREARRRPAVPRRRRHRGVRVGGDVLRLVPRPGRRRRGLRRSAAAGTHHRLARACLRPGRDGLAAAGARPDRRRVPRRRARAGASALEAGRLPLVSSAQVVSATRRATRANSHDRERPHPPRRRWPAGPRSPTGAPRVGSPTPLDRWPRPQHPGAAGHQPEEGREHDVVVLAEQPVEQRGEAASGRRRSPPRPRPARRGRSC